MTLKEYTKDRETTTDSEVKIYWRRENRQYKGRVTTRKFSMNFSVIISTKHCNRPNVVVDQTSY